MSVTPLNMTIIPEGKVNICRLNDQLGSRIPVFLNISCLQSFASEIWNICNLANQIHRCTKPACRMIVPVGRVRIHKLNTPSECCNLFFLNIPCPQNFANKQFINYSSMCCLKGLTINTRKRSLHVRGQLSWAGCWLVYQMAHWDPASSFTRTFLVRQTLNKMNKMEFWKTLQIRVELWRPYRRHTSNLLEGRRTAHGDMGMCGTLIVRPPFHTLISLNILRQQSCANSQNKKTS